MPPSDFRSRTALEDSVKQALIRTKSRRALQRTPSFQRLPLGLALAAALVSLGLAARADAATLTWQGSINDAWSGFSSLGAPGTFGYVERNNWGYVGPKAPMPSSLDNLVFAGVNRLANANFQSGLTLGSLSFAANAGAFVLSGINIGLMEGGIGNLSSKRQTLALGITAYADQTWSGGTAGIDYTGSHLGADGTSLVLASNFTVKQEPFDIAIGDAGQATLTVLTGSSVAANSITLGREGGSLGTVNLRGATSFLSAVTDFNVGDQGDGLLDIESGAVVRHAEYGYLGRSGGSGSVTVTDAGSRWTMGKDLLAFAGDLTVVSGGLVEARSAYLAKNGGNAMQVTVQGTGARLSVADVLNIGQGGQGTLSVKGGGSVAATQLVLGATGVLNLQGGTVQVSSALNAGAADNFAWYAGTLHYLGSTSTGDGNLLGRYTTLAPGNRLLVDGQLTVALNNELSLLGGTAELGSLRVLGSVSVSAFSTLAVGEGGLDNQGALQLLGGTLGGVGSLVNSAVMGGHGLITGSQGFINNGLFESSGGRLELANSGENINNGSWDMLSGRGLLLSGGDLVNRGAMTLNGDTISGTAALVNDVGGSLSGRGVISAAFRNDGRLVVDTGNLRVAGESFENTGQILMGSATAVLSGATVYNSGRIQGQGQVNNAISNSGTISALGAGTQLTLGLVDNLNDGGQQVGTMVAGSGATLLVTDGVGENLGTIRLAGGTFDNNGHGLENGATGVISGFGTLNAGSVVNQGRIQLSGGVSALYGDVLNASAANGVAAGQIILSGNSNTTFYGTVDVQSGAELRVSTGSVATFFGLVQQRTGARFTGAGAKRFEGGVSVGASPGMGRDEGDVEFGDGNVYLAEIGGISACTEACAGDDAFKNASFDKYIVDGSLLLGGTLKLVSWNGFVAQSGQHFDLLDWGSVSGQFDSIDAAGFRLAAGTQLDFSQLYTRGEVAVVGGVSAVPEPGTWALWLAGLVGLGALRRRGRAA